MLRDLRFALHLLAKDRWYSAVAIVALALGIGVNATVFTLVNAVLIRGLPFKDSGQLYMLGSLRARRAASGGSVSYADFQDWRAQTRSVRRPRPPSPAPASTSATIARSPSRRAERCVTAEHVPAARPAAAPRPRLRPGRRSQRRRAGRDHRLRHLEEPLRRRPRRHRAGRSASTASRPRSSASCRKG